MEFFYKKVKKAADQIKPKGNFLANASGEPCTYVTITHTFL